jgi:putative ABC transport system permease protein
MMLMLVFGATALALAAIGIYGVVAYAVEQRRHEFATRVALGASAGQVFWLVMRDGRNLALGGVLFGGMGAFIAASTVSGRVYGMRATDPMILTSAAAIVAALTFLATTIAALRASGVEANEVVRGSA